MVLMDEFGPNGSSYVDSRIIDMLEEEPVDEDGMLLLLRQIKSDWVKDHPEDVRGK